MATKGKNVWGKIRQALSSLGPLADAIKAAGKLLSDAKMIAILLVALVVLAIIGGLVWQSRSPDDPAPAPTDVFIEIDTEIIVVPNGSGSITIEWRQECVHAKDNKGNDLTVVVAVLWDPYRWTLGSTSHVGIDVGESVRIEDVIQTLKGTESRPVIVVGTASNENSEDNPATEADRAQRRADKLAHLFQGHYPQADIYSLNLGFYRKPAAPLASTDTQRRVAIMVIESPKGDLSNVDLHSGVRNALIALDKQNEELSLDVGGYSHFDEEKFRVKQRRK